MEKDQLKNVLKQVETKYGKGSLMNLATKDKTENIEVIHSGLKSLDGIIGIGGYPLGRIVEIYGPESSGKTTIALLAAAQVQKENKIAVFIDAEHALDPNYTQFLGVDITKLLISQPDSGEQALDLTNYLAQQEDVALIVVDSVASLIPKAELEGGMSEQTIGLHARMMSKSLRIISATAAKHNATIIFINQLREKVGVVFGNPEVTPGGRALKFYASLRMDVRIKERLKIGTEIYGHRIQIKIVKNKVAVPYRKIEVNFNFSEGFDFCEDELTSFLNDGIITQKGAWFYRDGKVFAKGKKEACQQLKNFVKNNED